MLRFTNLNASDLALSHSNTNNDLVITDNSTGQTVTVADHFLDGSHGLDAIQFADGSIWDRAAIESHASWLAGPWPGFVTAVAGPFVGWPRRSALRRGQVRGRASRRRA